MQQQVVVIHGGKVFKEYRQYIISLRTREVTKEKFTPQKDWKDSLPKELGPEFEVFAPKMPNGNNAVYEEWKIWFERMTKFLQNGVILIGHSLGGIFLAKYLSENNFSKKIKAVFLVAAPCNDVCEGEFLTGFDLPASLENFSRQAKNIYLCFSVDDPVVSFAEADKYHKALPGSEVITFENRQHFSQEFFPELIELIKKCEE
jgi:predicted alpha/beta hydrolase family esterase